MGAAQPRFYFQKVNKKKRHFAKKMLRIVSLFLFASSITRSFLKRSSFKSLMSIDISEINSVKLMGSIEGEEERMPNGSINFHLKSWDNSSS